MTVHTVFSIDDSSYLRWQAELLAYSHRKVAQSGPLTCLLSGDGERRPALERIFQTRSWRPHPVTGDDYPPYNRIFALNAWLREAPPEEETILLLDPDNVFLRPLEVSVERGRPISQPISYMHPPTYDEQLRKHCERPDELEGIGIPTVIHRDDLVELAPLWLAKTEALRSDPADRERLAWISDMWGYCIAARELGLRHELREMAQFQIEDRADLPIVHYCYGSESPDGTWEWTKRSYRAWERVEDPPPGVPAASVALIRLLNELVEVKTAEAPERERA